MGAPDQTWIQRVALPNQRAAGQVFKVFGCSRDATAPGPHNQAPEWMADMSHMHGYIISSGAKNEYASSMGLEAG